MNFRLPILLVCLTVILAPALMHAQAIQHKVTPRVIDREVQQRDIFKEIVTIENFSGAKITVYPTVNTVLVGEGGDITDFAPPSMSNNKITVTSWLEISRAGVEMMPGETIEVPLTIKIHPNAEAGLYHAFIGFGTGRNRDIAKRQVENGIAPGIIVTLAVDQKQTEFLKLGKFLIDRFVTSSENNAVSYTLTNPGTADVVPTGEIILSDGRGREVGAIQINPNNDVLIPGQESEYTAVVPTEGLMGKYKAFLSIDYGAQQIASVYDTAFFYIVPWRTILILFGILLFVVILLTVVIHRRYRTEDVDDEHGAEYVPLFVNDRKSDEKDHDINLKKE